jgi:hypothetical protein
MTFLGTGMLVARDFLIFALAVGNEGYAKKAQPTNSKQMLNETYSFDLLTVAL